MRATTVSPGRAEKRSRYPVIGRTAWLTLPLRREMVSRALRQSGDRVIHGVAEAFHYGIDVGGRRDIGWGDADVVTVLAVHGAAHWVDRQAAREGGFLDALVQFQGEIERRLGGAVGDQFDRLEQAAAADVADVAVVAEAFGEAGHQSRAHGVDVVDEVVVADDVLHGERLMTGLTER